MSPLFQNTNTSALLSGNIDVARMRANEPRVQQWDKAKEGPEREDTGGDISRLFSKSRRVRDHP